MKAPAVRVVDFELHFESIPSTVPFFSVLLGRMLTEELDYQLTSIKQFPLQTRR